MAQVPLNYRGQSPSISRTLRALRPESWNAPVDHELPAKLQSFTKANSLLDTNNAHGLCTIRQGLSLATTNVVPTELAEKPKAYQHPLCIIVII